MAAIASDELVSTNPATLEPVGSVRRTRRENVTRSVADARAAHELWRNVRLPDRAAVLREAARLVRVHADAIADTIVAETAKPRTEAIANELYTAVDHAAWLANEAPRVLADERVRFSQLHLKTKKAWLLYEPLGVVAAITPWNFPVILLAWKLAPAWLAGNTVVAKPSPYTPLTSLMVADILKEVVPPGVLNVLSGGNELGAHLAAHPGVRKISFTGSVATGKKIMGYAVEDLKRVTLELGGNDPAIVLDDVDPNAVAEGLFWGAFQNSGQVCTAIKRLYVHEKVYEPIVKGLVERAKKVRVGDGMDPETQLGPINNKMQLERVMGLVDDAKKSGGKIEAGGTRLEGSGYFYPPTIVTNVGAGVRLVDEEQFGTALPVLKYSKLDDALEQANRTHYGLGGSVWTGDVERGRKVVQELDSGTGWVNQHMDITPFAPFGGAKWSGIGYENGRWGYEAFTELQVVNTKKA